MRTTPSPRSRHLILLVALLSVLPLLGVTAADAQVDVFLPPAKADADALRVMTYNVRFASNASGHENWSTRLPDLAQQLQQSDVDLLGTQELKRATNAEGTENTQLADILDALGGEAAFGYIGTSRGGDDRPNDEQMGLYYRRDRLRLVTAGHFWLSPAPDEPYSFGYGNTGNSRMATWGHFVDLGPDGQGASEFYAVNTHFDHASNDARYRAADQIAGYFSGDPAYDVDQLTTVDGEPHTFRHDLPVVITGDFNFNRGERYHVGAVASVGAEPLERAPGNQPAYDPIKASRPASPRLFGAAPPLAGNVSPYHRLVSGGPFVDTWEEADTRIEHDSGTFTGFGELQDRWLDWVLASPTVDVVQSYVDTYRSNGEWPSDHLPVVADVVIPDHHDAVDIIAHRGASRYAPENTLPAVEMAIDMGAEMVEIDVSLSSDNQIILMHDNTLARTTDVEQKFAGDPRVIGGGLPQAFTAAELATLDASNWGRFAEDSTADDGLYAGAYLGTHVPTFQEVLDIVCDHPDVGILIELKAPALSPGIEQILIDQLEAEQAAGCTNPHVVQSFHPDSMALYAALQTASDLDLPVGQLHFASADAGEALRAQSSYADQFNPSHGTLTEATVDAAHAAGLHVSPYTVNDSARMAELVAIGVDGVITDRTDRLDCVLRGGTPAACDTLALPEPWTVD